MRYLLTVLVFGLIFGVTSSPAGEGKDDAVKELKKMEGTWVMVSGEEKGKPLSEEVVKAATLTISGDKHTVKVGDATIVGTHKVDPGKTPKQITASDTEGPYKDKTILGIYKVSASEFTVCFAPPGKDRPTEFTTKSGTGEILHTWKREKK